MRVIPAAALSCGIAPHAHLGFAAAFSMQSVSFSRMFQSCCPQVLISTLRQLLVLVFILMLVFVCALLFAAPVSIQQTPIAVYLAVGGC